MGRIIIRLIMVGILVVVGWFVWVQREAYIADSPEITGSEQESKETEMKNDSSSRFLAEDDVSADESNSIREPDLVIEKNSPPLVGDDAAREYMSVVRLAVPFVSQAPFRIWSSPYKEFCEEASLYSVHLFKENKKAGTANELDTALKDIKQWEESNLGIWKDTNAEETARILREKFGYANTMVVRGISKDDIKDVLDSGNPVIVPTRGRELDSPYFTPPGPLYHMLVIIGYDDETGEWITNDVGTNTKGAGQRYTYANLYDAIADWSHDKQSPTGQKVMIVVE